MVQRLPAPQHIAPSIAAAIDTEIGRGTPFILAPAFLAAGAIVYFSLRYEPSWWPLLAAIALLAPLAWATPRWPLPHYALVALLLFVMGMTAGKLETWRAGTKMLGGEISTELTGRVVAVEQMAGGRARLTIDVLSTHKPVLRYAPDRIRVSARKAAASILPGTVVTGLVRLLPPSGPVRPGSYDFSFEGYFDGIGASGYFLRGPVSVAAMADAPPVRARFDVAVERARDSIAERIRKQIGGPEGEIAAALVVGVRAGIPDDLSEALRRAGIYHVISISGLHMALVAGTVTGLLRGGFALFPGFASRRSVKKLAAALAIVALAGYLLISGGEVAAQRSFLMLAVMLVAVLFDRAALTMRNLAISAMLVILVSPHEVTGPSFQMSFAATAALVGAYAAWADYRDRRPARAVPSRSVVGRATHWVMAAMVGLAATSVVAGGATAVFSAYHFQQMPSLGLFTNLTAMPIVSLVVMPFAVLGMLAMPFGLEGPFFAVMGQGLASTLAIARWFAERSPLDVIGTVAPAGVIVLTAALAVATAATTWLRVAALPVAAVGLFLLPDGSAPDVFVSEDGRLIGVAEDGGRIAFNRTKPNAFTAENWQRAMETGTVVPPRMPPRAEPTAKAKDKVGLPSGRRNAAAADAEKAETPPAATGLDQAGIPTSEGFSCNADGICMARHPSGALVVAAPDRAKAEPYCAEAALIVIDDASAGGTCKGQPVRVVTRRDLARYGSAAIRFDSPRLFTQAGSTIAYAIQRPYRPWHEQRRFSRDARGLPPYRKQEQPPAPPAPQSEPTVPAPLNNVGSARSAGPAP